MAYRLGKVQGTQDDKGRVLFGFNILNEGERPIVTFGYVDRDDAAKAYALIEQAITTAGWISSG